MDASVIPWEKGYSDHPAGRQWDDSASLAGASSYKNLNRNQFL
jgi:hypothetical protein